MDDPPLIILLACVFIPIFLLQLYFIWCAHEFHD